MINLINPIKYNNLNIDSNQITSQAQIDSNDSVKIAIYNYTPIPFYTNDYLNMFNKDCGTYQMEDEQ